MYFVIAEKQTPDCASQYNNAGLSSKVRVFEKIASENADNCRSRQSNCGLTPLPQGTSAHIVDFHTN